MPSKTAKQRKFFQAAAHNPAFAKKAGVPVKVAKEFNKADTGKKFKEGGMALFKGKETPAEERKEAKALKSGKISKAQYVAGEKKEGHGAGAAKKASMLKSGKMSTEKYAKEHAYASGGTTKAGKSLPESKDMGSLGLKKGGKCKAYAEGGQPTAEQIKQMRQERDDYRQQKKSQEAYDKIQGSDTKKPVPGKAKGGSCSKYARGGGVELRGKTRGKFI